MNSIESQIDDIWNQRIDNRQPEPEPEPKPQQSDDLMAHYKVDEMHQRIGRRPRPKTDVKNLDENLVPELEKLVEEVRLELRSELMDKVRSEIHSEIWNDVYEQVRKEVWQPVNDQVCECVWGHAWHNMGFIVATVIASALDEPELPKDNVEEIEKVKEHGAAARNRRSYQKHREERIRYSNLRNTAMKIYEGENENWKAQRETLFLGLGNWLRRYQHLYKLTVTTGD